MKRFWMHTVGLVVIVGSVVFWLRLQGAPRYVALRGAEALYGGGSPDGLPFHTDELSEIGLTPEKAAIVLAEVRTRYFSQARIATEPEFRVQTGKDVLTFQVEVRPGVVANTAVEVIDENGRGVLLFCDLVSSYRACLFRAGGAENFAALNSMRHYLRESGVAGYWDLAKNRLKDWPQYTDQGELVAQH